MSFLVQHNRPICEQSHPATANIFKQQFANWSWNTHFSGATSGCQGVTDALVTDFTETTCRSVVKYAFFLRWPAAARWSLNSLEACVTETLTRKEMCLNILSFPQWLSFFGFGIHTDDIYVWTSMLTTVLFPCIGYTFLLLNNNIINNMA